MNSSRLDQLLAFHEEDPSDSFVRFALASEYNKLGDRVSARGHFEALRKHDPNYVGLYYHLGKLLEDMDQLTEALDVYRAGIVVAEGISDFHARSELQSALLEAEMAQFE